MDEGYSNKHCIKLIKRLKSDNYSLFLKVSRTYFDMNMHIKIVNAVLIMYGLGRLNVFSTRIRAVIKGIGG